MVVICVYLDLDSDQKAGPLLRDCTLFDSSSQDDILSMAVNMADVLTEPGQDPVDELTKGRFKLYNMSCLMQGSPTG
jgi:hypothetical protein